MTKEKNRDIKYPTPKDMRYPSPKSPYPTHPTNFLRISKHPVTKKWETALWFSDYPWGMEYDGDRVQFLSGDIFHSDWVAGRDGTPDPTGWGTDLRGPIRDNGRTLKVVVICLSLVGIAELVKLLWKI